MTFLLGSGAGFSGDRTDAPIPVVAELIRRGGPSALLFETLGERTLAAAHRAMREEPTAGYEPLLRELLEPVLGDCLNHGIAILGNFGAANPQGACELVLDMAQALPWPGARIGLVQGDDVRDRLTELDLVPWEAETEPLPDAESLISANVYLGAQPLVEALTQSAQVVVTGRVADPALFLAPLVHYFGWDWDDWDRLARGVMAGHLGECGAQITGGYFADPGRKEVPGLATLGYPIIEVESDGSLVITKPRDTGGLVTEQTVKEQLLYEVHDPSSYVTPDVVVDLSAVHVRQLGPDRVAVRGIGGKPAPGRLKTTICYESGWQAEAEISYAGPNALARARLSADVLRERLTHRVPESLRRRLDIIGLASVFDGDDGGLPKDLEATDGAGDYRLRLAVHHTERRWVERATQELLALYCTGPAGGGGVRRSLQRRIRTASYLVARGDVHTTASILQAEGARHATR
ncbi:MAG: acyclic terpene utilization AtuA family protein [Aquisalimonadaceae bacterium]